MVTVRSGRSFVLWSVATLGTWWLWLLYRWAGDVNLLYRAPRRSPGLVVVASVLTLGIAGFWYHWQLARDLQFAGAVLDRPVSAALPARVLTLLGLSAAISFLSGGLALALSMILLGWASWLVQDALNRLATAPATA